LASKRGIDVAIVSLNNKAFPARTPVMGGYTMLNRICQIVVGIGLVALTALWVGCSDTTRVVTTQNDGVANQIVNYFPLDQGYTTIFTVTTSGVSSQRTFFMAGDVRLGSADAERWVINSGSTVDTSYFVATDSALYFLETASAAPEKILALPLTPGASWPRYNNYDVTGYYQGGLGTGTGAGYTDPLGGKDTTTSGSGGGEAAKNYPSDGGNTFTVVGTETVNVGSLGSFSGAVKVSNVGYGGTTNLYWYVPGVGLVKYQLGTNADGSATPQTEGVLEARN
jgi:hypothetical protein